MNLFGVPKYTANTHAAFSGKGRHPSLLSHLDVVLPPPATRLMYPFTVSSAAPLPFFL
jgi:hypothetical protein